MKTDIESLLKSRREELDIESPPKDAWDEIRQTILVEQKHPKAYAPIWWKVAAVVFLASSLVLLIHNMKLNNKVDELASLGDISVEYKGIEENYEAEIGQLTSQISMQEVLKAQDLSWMLDELKALDEVNEQYRKDIGNSADKELLVEALIDYYEKKIRLLKKLELEINRRQNEERTNTHISAI